MRKEGWRWVAVSVLILSALSGCAANHPSGSGEWAAGATLTGIVISRTKMVLPRDALIRVELVDISRKDAPARTIGLQEISTGGRQFPISFGIPYGPAVIEPDNVYAIQVHILQGRQLLLYNNVAYPVITNGIRSNIEVIVEPVPGT